MYPAFGCFIALAIVSGRTLNTEAMGICGFQLRFPGNIPSPSEGQENKTKTSSLSADIVTQEGVTSEKLPYVTLMTTVLNELTTPIADTTNPVLTSQKKRSSESVSNVELMTSALNALKTTTIDKMKTPSPPAEEVTQTGVYSGSLPDQEPVTTILNELTTTIVGTTNPISTSQTRGASESVSHVEMMTLASEDMTTISGLLQISDCSPWQAQGNYMYMVPEGVRKFDESRQLCQACGGDIAVFYNTDVSGTIRIIMDEIGGGKSSIWIGITRVQPERVLFAWLDGRLFSDQDSSWSREQPNDSDGQQDCVVSFRDSWLLQDKACTQKFYTLCQKGIGP